MVGSRGASPSPAPALSGIRKEAREKGTPSPTGTPESIIKGVGMAKSSLSANGLREKA